MDPAALGDREAAPLLCAGIIGFRSLRVAGVENRDRVGLFGFGASAHLVIHVLKSWNCEVYVSTRGESQWVKNVRANPTVTLTTKSGAATYQAREMPAPQRQAGV